MANEIGTPEDLIRFLARLEPDAVEEPVFLDQLRELGNTLSSRDLAAISAPKYAFERYMPAPERPADVERLRRIRRVVEEMRPPAEPAYRVARREVPLVSSIIADSQPEWAAGQTSERSIGPVVTQDGRQLWFDLFPILQLVPLYLSGQPDPALLFFMSSRPVATGRGAQAGRARYELGAGSIWVRADLLAANAPAQGYVGFSLQSGEIVLSEAAQVGTGGLTLPPGATCSVTLRLQPAQSDRPEPSRPPNDAASASLQTPDGIRFHFSQTEQAVDAVGRCAWTLYGQQLRFEWSAGEKPVYNELLKGVLVPLRASSDELAVEKSASPFVQARGSAGIVQSGWLLPVAQIDTAQPTSVTANGSIAVQGNSDLSLTWPGLRAGPIYLPNPWIVLSPNLLTIVDLQASNLLASQRFLLWQGETSPYRSSVEVRYGASFPLYYAAASTGDQVLLAQVDTEARLDRPVDAGNNVVAVRATDTLMYLIHTETLRRVYLIDANVLLDNFNPGQPQQALQPLALALHNALFTVTPVAAYFLIATLRDDEMVETGNLSLLFGMYGLLPTLPDPYAANDLAFRRRGRGRDTGGSVLPLLLLCQMLWHKAAGDEPDDVNTRFHILPLTQAATSLMASSIALAPNYDSALLARTGVSAAASSSDIPLEAIWDRLFRAFYREQFALLDVSTNADWMGVSFAWFDPGRVSDNDYIFYRIYGAQQDDDHTQSLFPLQVDGLDMTAEGRFVRAFTVPQHSWEPLFNLTPPSVAGDPPALLNYYPDDGGPTRLFNDNREQVPVAPLPKVDELLAYFHGPADGFTGALFTLPFGLKAFAEINKNHATHPDAGLRLNRESFRDGALTGALQIQVNAPERQNESPMFIGGTLQLNNIVLPNGTTTGTGTLGSSVAEIFNNEFFVLTGGYGDRGVPLERIDFSGYGASTFSHWENPNAAFAETSQAHFDVFIGRTAHEVIQVKSVVYPWGIRVVRTIVIFRVSSSYVYRFDTGWQAETPGVYDFSYYVHVDLGGGNTQKQFRGNPYEFHPGIVKGVFNVRNITETPDIPIFDRVWNRSNGETYIDDANIERVIDNTTPAQFRNSPVRLQPVYFDADVEIEFVKSGAVQGRVPSKGMLGYVQLGPKGQPIPETFFRDVLREQFGSLGGPVDCVIDIGASGQQMRVVRVDVSESVDGGGTKPLFVSTARGSVILPKDGAWSAVQYQHASGEVSPLPDDAAIPLIRLGKLGTPSNAPLRLENPMELVRNATPSSIFFGLLQSTGTQKVLFRKPRYEEGLDELLSELPDFADAYRMLNSVGIFPNLEDAIPLNLGAFKTKIIEEGFRLLDEANPDAIFEMLLPDGPWYIINEDFLKIYIEYDKRDKDGNKQADGVMQFGIDSAAAQMGRRWLSKLNNIAMIVDLGPLTRLMLIKGKFDAEKGAAPAFQGPELEFSDALQPVIDILQILLMLQGGDYKDAFAKGLEIAMSNSADSWNYAFHARKEIPLVRFPPPALDSPTAPLKLEASLGVGVYFNEVFALTDNPGQLIPSAGAFLDFYGRLSVMCVSVAAATIYATGSVDLRIAADIKTGPSLQMAFGFGAEINVGLPVIGTISLLYMVGVEIILNSTELTVGAFLLFRGRAEILGGIVTVTIYIEAKGMIQRLTGSDATNMIAQVTFGLDISIFLVINISFSESWQETRQLA